MIRVLLLLTLFSAGVGVSGLPTITRIESRTRPSSIMYSRADAASTRT